MASDVIDEVPLLDMTTENLKEYALSVATNRALADFRDGLKPVHRRIIWSMASNNFKYNGPFFKCSRVVGDCFIKGTKVSTPEGYKTIESLEIGDLVKTSKGNFPVTNLFHNPPAEIVTVILNNGMKTSCTLDQEFKVKVGDKFFWKQAKDLLTTDEIVVESD